LAHPGSSAILEEKILIPNDQADILHVPDKTSVKINPSDGQPGQPLEKKKRYYRDITGLGNRCLIRLKNSNFSKVDTVIVLELPARFNYECDR
jgi:hypothetical protein